MSDIIIALGSRENVSEDIHILSRKSADNPEIIVVTGKDIKNAVVEKASSLFTEKNFVLVLLDPPEDLISTLKTHLFSLKERIQIILYYTSYPSSPSDFHKPIEGNLIIREKDRDKRIKERVLVTLKKHGKVMTDKGFQALKEKIKDESILEVELMKLINFMGERQEIKSKDVLSIVTETHEESLFHLFDELAGMKKKEALNLFENLLLNGLHILAVHGYLVKQTRLMLQAKDMEEVFRTGSEYNLFLKAFNKWKEGLDLKPFDKKQHLPYQKTYYAYNLSKTSQKMKRKDLINFFNALTNFDIKVKKGTKFDRVFLEYEILEA
jgi:DNA polymerase III delta subunit